MKYTCEQCGVEFKQRPSHRARKKYAICGKACANKFYVGERNSKWKKPDKQCINCGKLFKSTSKKRKYCSRDCAGIGNRKRIYKICPICENEYFVINAIVKKNIACSRDCASKVHSIRMRRDGNPAWLGGVPKNGYPIKFSEELKEQVRLRQSYKCVLCYNRRRSELEALSVHHIDYNKNNNDIRNLIALCRHCHARTNYNRKYWIKVFSWR